MPAARRVLVIKARTVLNNEDIPDLKGALQDMVVHGCVHAVLNLQGLKAMTTEVVWILEQQARRLHDYRGGLWVCGASPKLQATMVLALPGLLLPSFPFVQDEPTAMLAVCQALD